MSKSPSSEKKALFVAPTFYKPLVDLSTSQGECLVLECRVKGVPPPKITWKREGDVIEDCPDFRMLHKGEIATLVIGEAFPEDTGIFTCEAFNKAGVETTSCKIVVKGGGYHSISTKTAAAITKQYQHPRPTQVLPATKTLPDTADKSTDSSIKHLDKPETHISQLTFTPKHQRSACNKSSDNSNENHDAEVVSSLTSDNNQFTTSCINVTSSSITSLPSTVGHQVHDLSVSLNNSTEPLLSSSSYSSVTKSSFMSMATTTYNAQSMHNSDENHNFKAEKDQLLQEVAQTVTSPQQKQGRQARHSSRELAIIERDIEIRHAMTISSPTSPHQPNAQEYKVSTFEQRLMNEIEYRLERTPPVNEDPSDGIYEDVPLQQQTPPTFQTTLKNFKAMDGTSAKFICRVSAKPKAKVYWFKDGKQISKRSQHYLQKSNGEGEHELHIPHLCLEDDGNYTALATNPQGRVSSTGRLAMVSERSAAASKDITSPSHSIMKASYTSPCMTSPMSLKSPVTSPQHLSTSVMSLSVSSPKSPGPPKHTSPPKGQLADDEESPVEKYYRPTFIQKPAADTHTEEGKLVRFDVKVTGLPTPDLEWLINGRPVRQDSLHRIMVRENNVHSLLFERVSAMDEGQYTITASNKAGTAVIHVQLHVTPREHLTAPAFIQRLVAQCVAEGDAVRLEARVVATPRPNIFWKRGSDQVMSDSRTQLYEDDSGYVCLQITQAQLSDAAWYTCSASNKAGVSSCNCKLDVFSPNSQVTSHRRRIKTPHRYANLAKVAGVDMREALSPDAQPQHLLQESVEL